MTTYNVQGPGHAGGQITLAAPGGATGDLCPTGQGVGLLVMNGGTAAITVTIPISSEFDSTLSITSRTVSVPNGASPTLIPMPPGVYGNTPTAVNYSSVTSVTVAAIRVNT
jgi:hypothetical protein